MGDCGATCAFDANKELNAEVLALPCPNIKVLALVLEDESASNTRPGGASAESGVTEFATW